MSPAQAAAKARAAACYARAEDAKHPRDKAALRSAAEAWERIAGPGVPWSLAGEQRDLKQLKRDFAAATGPFQPPRDPRAPSPNAVKPLVDELRAAGGPAARQLANKLQESQTIEF